MEDPLDQKLSNRIIEIFDEFEDDSADLGWQQLREKYPVKSTRPIAWLWVGSAAALLLIFFSVGIFLIQEQKPTQEIARHTPPIKKKIATTVTSPEKKAAVPKNEEKNILNTVAATKVPDTKASFHTPVFSIQKQASATVAPFDEGKNANQPLSLANQSVENNLTAMVLDSNQSIAQVSQTPPVVQVELPGENAIHSFLDDEKNTAKTASDKKINFGVFAGTYLSYAEGSDNQFNLGAGISSDIKLSKNLKLSTGIAILQNTFNYERHTPPAALNVSNDSPISGKMQMLSSPVSSSGQAKGYHANLVGIDIPINLKYEFNPTKNNFYIAAGFSSGTFINESYTYQNGGAQAMGFTNNQQQEENTPDKHFDNFNFAKTLNLSFGTGYELGNHNKLFIEPFLKYPLQGIGAENLRFGSGGINLRLNFQSSNK